MGYRKRRNGYSPAMAGVLACGFVLMIALSKATSALGAVSIPIWAMAIGGVVLVMRGPLGEALLHSLAQGDQDREVPGTDPALLQELDDLRAQVAELQERMDFSERLLAREREARPIGGREGA